MDYVLIDLGDAVFFLKFNKIKKLVSAGAELNRIRFGGKTTTVLILAKYRVYNIDDDIKYSQFLIGLGADVFRYTHETKSNKLINILTPLASNFTGAEWLP